MSNPGKNIIALLTVRLFAIGVVAAALLGVVYAVTAEPIAQQKVLKEQNGMAAVLSQATEFETITEDAEDIVGKVSLGSVNGEPCGYVATVYPSGFGGTLTVMVGIDTSGTLTGVRILSMAETPGLGANASNPEFYEQYTGRSNLPLVVSKSASADNEIQAITSATITSEAVTSGVNAVYSWFEQNGGVQ
ncbi:MAG: RnfABCDGE type electron transport complex subunit G [Firmicutes bacterium]|nr:RnfABCDGE type electron transport complex subunit G [Bacillota bacterium]